MKNSKFSFIIKSQRHHQALQYALTQIQQSKLNLWVEKVYLYGSCARGEESWNSDIDLLVQLHAGAKDVPNMKRQLLLLKGCASTDMLEDPEADVKFVFGSEWENSSMLFYRNVKRDGVNVWQ